MASIDGIPELIPPKPEEPDQEDCCGTGCTPCVFDIYEQELKLWEEVCRKFEEGEVEGPKIDSSNVLSPNEYKPFIIGSIKTINHDTKIYTFFLPANSCLGLQVGQHLILRSGGLARTVTRQYTPVSCLKLRGRFEVVIKVYPNGKMSKYVREWEVGTKVFWRGPFGEFSYKPNQYKRVLMLAGGTGIAPMLQVIRHIVDNEDDETVIKLFYGCKTFLDIIFKDELDEWASYWNFSVQYFLSQDNEVSIKSKKKYCDDIQIGRISRDVIQKELDSWSKSSTLVLISGTKSFDKDMINFSTKAGLPNENIFKF